MLQTVTPKGKHYSHVEQHEMVSLHYNKLPDETLIKIGYGFNNILFLESHFFSCASVIAHKVRGIIRILF